MDDFHNPRTELIGTIQDLNKNAKDLQDNIAYLKGEYDKLQKKANEVEKLKVQEEKMKLQLSIAILQEELNKHSPAKTIPYRFTCPFCKREYNTTVEVKYFSEEG